MSIIKEKSLAPEGHRKIDWAWDHMPVLSGICKELADEKPLAGKNVTICLHIEAKTACLALTLKELGANVSLAACNPLSTQDEVVAALDERGINVFGIHGASPEEYDSHILAALENPPDLIIDDGGDLVTLLHGDKKDLLPRIIGGCEETTTGIMRLRQMEKNNELKFPMISVNDARCKYLFDNRYGTGQSVWTAISDTTNLLVAGKTVVVAGYGWCGKGVAMRARALGANIIVTEIDPIKAIEAIMDGYEVMPMIEAAPLGDFFITVTGNRDIIDKEHLAVIKDQAVLANAGHFDIEISVKDLEEIAISHRLVRKNIVEYCMMGGKRVYLLADGRLVNLAAGQGHPVEIMDLSFAIQVESLLYLNKDGKKLGAGVSPVPIAVDNKVAGRKLSSINKDIDVLTDLQKEYWEANTL